MIFAFLTAIFLSLHALAADDSCTTIRLDVAGGSMASVPVHNQGNYGDCYAQAAVEMIDAYRFSHGDTRTGEISDALMASAGYAQGRLFKKK